MILIRINLLKFSLQRLPLPRPRPLNFNGYLEIEKKSHYIISYSAVIRFLFSFYLSFSDQNGIHKRIGSDQVSDNTEYYL